MHVCVLLAGRYPSAGRVRTRVAALREAGHAVTVVCRGGAGQPDRETIDGVDVRRVPDTTPYSGFRGKLDGARYALRLVRPAWLRAVEDVADERAIDACCAMDLRLVTTGLRVGEAHDSPVIADLPGNAPALERRRNRDEGWGERLRTPRKLARRVFVSPWRLGRIETGSLREVDRLVTTCEEARARYVREVGIDPERVAVVHDVPADPGTFETDGRVDRGLGFDPGTAFVVTAFVGGNDEIQRDLADRETLVDAAARAADDAANLRVVLVGDLDPEAADALETRARRALAGGRITFRTETDPDRIPAYVAASDVCVVPAPSPPVGETAVPPTLFRAMAMGVPVVTTDIGPASRIVGETDAGRVVPAGDREALTGALVALADPDTAAAHGTNGRGAIERRYGEDAARLDAIYATLPLAAAGRDVRDLRTVPTGGSPAP